MYKLANQVLDIYDDTQFTVLKKLANINPKINVVERDEVKDFALSIITKKAARLDKFPIDSHDSTWLSNQYFNETHDKLPKIAQEIAAHNIKVACVIFKVKPTESVEKLAKDHHTSTFFEQDNHRTYSDIDNMSKFAEVEKISNNETFAKYAFATREDVETATKYFEEYQKEFPTELRHKYASAVQRRAGELGFSVKGSIEKYAGNSYSAHVDAHLSARKSLVNDTMAAALTKMASIKNDMLPTDFAKLLFQFDKRANLTKYYGGYLTDPFLATFSTQPNPKCLFKTASGDRVTPDNLGKLFIEKHGKLKEYFGSDLADALKKDPVPIFESLPNDAKEIIVGIADGTL